MRQSKHIYFFRCWPEYIFFKAQTDCLVEKMSRQTRSILYQTLDKTFFEKTQNIKVCLAPKTIWSHCTLINIKRRYANVDQHSIEPQKFLKSTQSPSPSHLLSLTVQYYVMKYKTFLEDKLSQARQKNSKVLVQKFFYSNLPQVFKYKKTT